ncbi:armadillo-type protein [Hygrophoropsis aurantiaca]|uniref:Armadillo-type protein n=1 Tax=Hygrophoropsis aurantiaca TaxID=72124 RepID=A0ACB8A253_9AGAM|nr:armadillo-type protein [Hygrophoropsis aurantiaca]
MVCYTFIPISFSDGRIAADTRETILRSRALTVFLDVLEHPSGDVEGIGGRCVKVLGGYPDAQEFILQVGFVKKLVELSKSRVSDKSQSATRVIISLIDNGDSKLIRSVLVEHGFINTTIKQLRKQNYCHFAVAALGFFVKFDDLREVFLKSGAISSLIRMLRRGWFDGIADDNPLRSLSIILQHPDVRTAMLESGAIETLSKTLSSGEDASVSFASLKYIRIFASYEDGIDAIARKEAVLPIMHTLKSPHAGLRLAGACTLSFLANQNVFVQSAIVNLGRFEFWQMLRSRRPHEVVGASNAIRALANHKELRDSFPEPTVLQSIYDDGTLPNLPPRRDSMSPDDDMLLEIHRLVESLRSGIGHDGSHPDDPFVAPRKRSSVLFVAALIPTILCCPCLLLCGLGQIAYQELLEEE